MRFFLTTTWLSALIAIAFGGSNNPISISATLRGKKYTISDVTTVGDIKRSLENLTGLPASKQGVLFSGRKLSTDEETLENAGVQEGSLINVIPSSGKSSSKAKKNKDLAFVAAGRDDDDGDGGNNSSAAAGSDFFSGMDKMLKDAGIDESKMKEMMKSMGGGGGGMPDMMEGMKQMQEMMKSPLFKEYMSDPEKLEQSRQMILQNPMMKSMMAGLPGFDEILNDPEKWRETMIAAASMYESMGSSMESMMQSMGGMGGMGTGGMGMGGMGMGGMGMGGMGDSGVLGGFDSSSTSSTFNSALDELSESDE